LSFLGGSKSGRHFSIIAYLEFTVWLHVFEVVFSGLFYDEISSSGYTASNDRQLKREIEEGCGMETSLAN
jgi:hypothetical protein